MIRNTSGQVAAGQVINATSGAGFSGTVTVYITIDGGTQTIGSVGSGLCANEGNGLYTYRPTAAETNGAAVSFTFTGSGAVPSSTTYDTLSAAQNTALILASNPNITPLTAVSLITRALKTIGVLSAGDTPGGDMITDSFLDLNEMMGTLAIQPKTIPSIAREVFTLTANQGGAANPYTIGPGGDFNTSRPASLTGAGMMLGTTGVELPRGIMTDDIWQNTAMKDLSSSMFTAVYYDTTFTAGLSNINLWPVPDTATNALVLYRPMQLSAFLTLTATYFVQNGYAEMLRYQLANRLAIVFQKSISSELREMIITSLALVKRANYTLFDLPTDPALTSNRRAGYDINQGNC